MTTYIRINQDGTIAQQQTQNTSPAGAWIEVTGEMPKAKQGYAVVAELQPANTDGTQLVAHCVLLPDNRGKTAYLTTDGSEVKIDYIGELHDNHTFDPRPSPHHKWVKGKWVLDKQSHQADYIADIKQAIQTHIDTTAQSKDYNNGVSCASYAGYDNPFQAEAIVFAKWRSDVWHTVAQLQAQAIKTKTLPSADDVLAQLPTIDW